MGLDGKGFVGKLLKLISVAGSMMTREQRAGLARLMLRWTEGRAALHLQAASDDDFLELCESYELACDASAYWSSSNAAGAGGIADEYRLLISELEVEAREWSRGFPDRVNARIDG